MRGLASVMDGDDGMLSSDIDNVRVVMCDGIEETCGDGTPSGVVRLEGVGGGTVGAGTLMSTGELNKQELFTLQKINVNQRKTL